MFCQLFITAYGKNSSLKPNRITSLAEFLEKSLNRTILEYTLNPLTKRGENFGAILKSVAVKDDEVSLSIQISIKLKI